MADFLAEAEAVAVRAAREAGKVLMKHFRTDLQIELKGNTRSIVTIADKESDALVRKLILEKFPSHGIISEENEPKKGDGYVWHIDPLDGTTNYSRGIAYFCVSIALAKDGELLVGVVYDPVRSNLYTAAKGRGAFLNGAKIVVPGLESVSKALLVFDFCPEEGKRLKTVELMKKLVHARNLRIAGSAALSLCELASGFVDGYVHMCGNSWDFAAGALLVREAGGVVTFLNGTGWSPDSSNGIVAGNPAITDGILKTLKCG
ncbi:inositol monophosphatase [Candidatus Woesearchaeota archaeon]|nr:inositol monophosphatase [Candidatus Woesearchaeota archaeon]